MTLAENTKQDSLWPGLGLCQHLCWEDIKGRMYYQKNRKETFDWKNSGHLKKCPDLLFLNHASFLGG
jgi:hypothetical protein